MHYQTTSRYILSSPSLHRIEHAIENVREPHLPCVLIFSRQTASHIWSRPRLNHMYRQGHPCSRHKAKNEAVDGETQVRSVSSSGKGVYQLGLAGCANARRATVSRGHFRSHNLFHPSSNHHAFSLVSSLRAHHRIVPDTMRYCGFIRQRHLTLRKPKLEPRGSSSTTTNECLEPPLFSIHFWFLRRG